MPPHRHAEPPRPPPGARPRQPAAIGAVDDSTAAAMNTPIIASAS
ncbi:hypothetical protein BMAGB8_0264, partial [Burkholderia mallei GB8 horse 4]